MVVPTFLQQLDRHVPNLDLHGATRHLTWNLKRALHGLLFFFKGLRSGSMLMPAMKARSLCSETSLVLQYRTLASLGVDIR